MSFELMLKRRIFLLLLATPLLAADTDWIARLGGKIEHDSAGRIVAVNLRGSWINDVDMIELSRLPDLERLDLSHTRISDDSGTELIDTLTSQTADAEQTVFEHRATHFIADAVQQSLSTLDPRERFVVEHRLMADGDSELSLAEIGRRLGVSRERARQLEARAKRKLSARRRPSA